MTHTSTEQPREKCTACNGAGTGKDGFDCLRCDGDGWVFTEPAAALAHTQQPCMPQATLHSAQEECIKLQARIAELKAERDDLKTRLEAALRCVERLEASQAQRVALSEDDIRFIYGGGDDHWRMVSGPIIRFVRSIEGFHGITQEKQG